MTTALQMPVQTTPGATVGPRMFRKQILKTGTLNYKGRELKFDKDYLSTLVQNFNAGAEDQVPFFLVDGQGQHNEDPERYRGEVKGLELTADGLDAIVELTADGAKLVTDNPRLGVSARLLPAKEHGDGRKFGPVLRHVAGTTDPRVTQMSGWEAVSLSNEDALTVVDLTAVSFDEPKEASVAEVTEAQQAILDKLAALPADRLDALLAAEPASPDPTEDEIAAAVAALEADANKDEPAGAALSAEAQAAIDLANSRAEQAEASAAQTARALARAQWLTERQTYLAAGVDPAALDLAAPWCGGDTPTGFIDLSNADTSPDAVAKAAGETMRKFLELRKGTVDLSVRGEAADEASDDPREDPAYKQWLAENPITV